MIRILIVMVALFNGVVFAQGWYPSGTRANSMGGASVSYSDVWSYYNNPGASAEITELSIGVGYENRFLLKELQMQTLAAAIPLKVGVITVGGHMYGYNKFRSSKAGLGYSMKLSEMLSAGVQINYQGIRLTENYGSKNTLTGEAGLFCKVNEKINVGFSIFNLGRTKLSDFEDDRFSTVLKLGGSYLLSEKALIAAEVEKDLENPIRLKAGVEYLLIDNLYLRGGMATGPTEFSFGLGYHFTQFQIDLGSSYHQLLGWAPNVSFVFNSKK
jgi:hypothetical protein